MVTLVLFPALRMKKNKNSFLASFATFVILLPRQSIYCITFTGKEDAGIINYVNVNKKGSERRRKTDSLGSCFSIHFFLLTTFSMSIWPFWYSSFFTRCRWPITQMAWRMDPHFPQVLVLASLIICSGYTVATRTSFLLTVPNVPIFGLMGYTISITWMVNTNDFASDIQVQPIEATYLPKKKKKN